MWMEKTNKGRVVYDRKPHAWTSNDVERIVKSYTDNNEPEVPMLSDLADRILFFLARRLALDEAAGFVAKVVVRISDILRGISYLADPRTAGITKEEEELLEWVAGQAGSGNDPGRPGDLQRIRGVLSSMIEYIDKELEQ
jgi:hypothetical protein